MSRRILLLVALTTTACIPDEGPRGVRLTPGGAGPRVVFDLQAHPLPDVPFPNDLLTRPDNRAPTGRRLNLSLQAPTAAERRLRAQALQLDGFGTFAPITVRFDAPLDVEALDGRGRDPAVDPILVVDVTEGPTFGERVPLDLGRGLFPLVLLDPTASAFAADPRAGEGNLIFETVDEDIDGDGRLSPTEDTDGDGRLDRPNVTPPGGDPERDLLTFYERETDTLVLRTTVPLRPAHTYAVVLTTDVRGADGQTVRSPFVFVHHTRQTEALARLDEALAPHGRAPGDVAFAWAFTTQSTISDLAHVRDGINGRGPFAELAERFPPAVSRVQPLRDRAVPEAVLLRGPTLTNVLRLIGPWIVPPPSVAPWVDTFAEVDYLVAGRFVTPYLLVDDDDQGGDHGDYPGDEDEIWRLDPLTGEVTVGAEEVPFWCAVPRAAPDRAPPFPVVLFAHGHRQSKVQGLTVAGTLARWGFATCALDAVGHGMNLDPAQRAVLEPGLENLQARPLLSVFEGTRARDLNNDGRPDPGADTFTTDALHTRDVLRQSALDWLQFVRVLRGFDGQRQWSQPGVDGTTAGDFDGDGVVDLGGPGVPYAMTGAGYGGMLAMLAGAVEPALASVAPISAGGGLMDIALRTGEPGVPEALMLRSVGPLVVGFPAESGITTVSFVVDDVGALARSEGDDRGIPFATLPPLVPGDRLVLTNLTTDEQSEGQVGPDGAFRVAVAADSQNPTQVRVREGLKPWLRDFAPQPVPTTVGLGDPLRLDVFDLSGRLKNSIDTFEQDVDFEGVVYPAGDPLVAIRQGFGLRRQTPSLRRFAQVLQTMMTQGDPINYAPALVRPDGPDVLLVVSVNDPSVPTAHGLSLARAIGLVSPADDARLVEAGVTRGVARLGDGADPDALSGDTPALPDFDPPLRNTVDRDGGGQHALRIVPGPPEGLHAPLAPAPHRAFDAGTYVGNLLGQFFARRTAAHRDCLAHGTCD